jgi:vancomycin resistance protein YoaR
VVAVALVAAAGAGLGHAARSLLPAEAQVARGLIVDGIPVGASESIDRVVDQRVDRRLGQRVSLVHEGRVILEADLGGLGGSVDRSALGRAVQAVGRTGSIWQRLDDAWQARQGRLAVSLPLQLPVDRLARSLSRFKLDVDRAPEPARWDFAAARATEHADGALVDLYATAHAAERALRGGEPRVPIALRTIAPRATQAMVATIDRSQVVARYQTRFAYLGDQAGRAQNIRRASEAVDGMVLLPGEVVSFNAVVGPRSLDNGFARAGEIYKGEMRMGVGGGTCQVASTLYSAAFFGAVDVVERSPHSRPSGYVPLGLDATVAYPHVDLKLRNPHPFPIVVHAIFEPGVLTFELLGRRRPAQVEYDAATTKVAPYKRKIREASWLPPGKVVRKQKGIRGLTVRKLRLIRALDGRMRTEKTTDVYPATDEIYLVAPGTDVEEALPPLPEGVELDHPGQDRARAKPSDDGEGPTYPGEDEGLG